MKLNPRRAATSNAAECHVQGWQIWASKSAFSEYEILISHEHWMTEDDVGNASAYRRLDLCAAITRVTTSCAASDANYTEP